MKKFLHVMAFTALTVGLLAVQSCDNEDGPGEGPIVVLDKTTDQNIPGGKITVKATVTAPNGGQALTVFVAGVEDKSFDMAGAAEFEQTYEYTIPANAVVASKIVITFQARDNLNYSSGVANLVVTVGDPVVILGPGNLTTQTLRKGTPYLIKGQTFVRDGVVLTVEPGAIIKGDKATKGTLVIAPGGRLVANGTATDPIVFTSAQAAGERDRGDWGGIVVLGNAFVNQTTLPAIEGIDPPQTYGNNTSPTTNADHNAGTLRFVRIEFAGIELTPNNETNSLTLGGVGRGTVVENVQVSFGGDDGFEWFGGTVNGKFLVSHSTWDDDFDTDFGWSGNVQYGLVVRNPFFADQSGSNAFESDNQGNGNAIAGLCDASATAAGTALGCTHGVFSNITVLGPRETNARSISGNYQNALHIRRRSAISVFNSFISGFRIGLRIDDDGTFFNLVRGHGVHANNVLSVPGPAGTGSSATAAEGLYVTGIRFTAANDGTIGDATVTAGNATPLANYWTTNANTGFNNISAVSSLADIGITTANFWAGQTADNYPSNPNFALGAGASGNTNNLNTGASYANSKLSDGFFVKTGTFRGAFGNTDWTDGWAEFQPRNKAY